MGSAVIVQYSNTTLYKGGVEEGLPHSKGRVCFKKSGATLQGDFVKGKITKGRLKTKEFEYQGQFQKGQICGQGILEDKTNALYRGQFKQGKLNKGQVTKKNQNEVSKFTGSFQKENNFEGVVTIRTADNLTNKTVERVLQGTFDSDNLTNKGKYTFQNGDLYDGNFYDGVCHGAGLYKGSDFNVQSVFKHGCFNGQTTINFTNGDKYEGNTKEGKMNGWGKYTYKDGTVYEGDFYFGSMWGTCKIQFGGQSQIESYQGEVADGIFNGIGTVFYANGVIFKGTFFNGAKNGHGILIYGTEKFKCMYLMNKLMGQLKKVE